MKELVFQVELKSDIVLPASSNTQGKIDTLDFIAGSNFLGMVAQKYTQFQNSFDVFHSGKVRFGDGHILKEDEITYKIPYSYFHKKLDDAIIYNHHKLEDTDFEPEDEGGLGQLKQLREGYITVDKKYFSIETVYSQKSAYDTTKRTSEEGQMYGYTALKKGSIWQFVVKVDGISTEDETLLIETLQKSKRLGKSKSAEYGEVKITGGEVLTSQNGEAKASLPNGEVVLYCNSRLALVDECGNPTYDLKYLCNDIKILYEKTQIRTSTFTPYNGARKTKDYERVCINKGSVIVVKSLNDTQKEQIQKGVGAFLSEGFGEILINPPFLRERDFKLIKECKDTFKKNERECITETFKDTTVQFLVNRHNQSIATLDLANKVADFVKNKKTTFSNIKSSQWGNIRSIASSGEDDFMKKITEYITTGVKAWETHQSQTLMNEIKSCKLDQQKFTKLLAMTMGGQNDSK